MKELLDNIIGMSPTEASKIVREQGFLFRIMVKDGLKFNSCNNDLPTRINVKVENNEITEVLSIG